MSDGVRREDGRRGAGEWWEALAQAPQRARGRGARSQGRVRRRPLHALAERTLVNSRFRRFTTTIGVTLAIVLVVGCAVLVIMLNNVIIKRTNELGELDRSRRQLRTDNALLAAEIARLSAPPRVVRLARKQLGMVPSETMARFIYLDPANQPMTEERRRRIARRARRQRRAALLGQQAAQVTARSEGKGT